MSLIDITYFQGEINIPGVTGQHVAASVNLFIIKYEEEYLQAALGYSFWKLFIDGLAEPVPADRWVSLRDGEEYENADGKTKKWKGFINTARISPIADYVYYWLSRDAVSYTTTSGEVESKKENAVNTSSAQKQTKAYNSMIDATKVLWDYLLNAKGDDDELLYPEFDSCDVDDNVFRYLNIFNL